MKTYKAGDLREDMLVVPVHMLEGFALVPVEPTPEMVEALKARICVTNRGGILNAGHALAAAIAAAPKGDSHE